MPNHFSAAWLIAVARFFPVLILVGFFSAMYIVSDTSCVPGPTATSALATPQVNGSALRSHRLPCPPPPCHSTPGSQLSVPDRARIGGNARSMLPAGEPGVLDVIPVGVYYAGSGSVPLVIRNNTSQAVTAVMVSGEIFDARENLLASGMELLFHPYTLQPGEAALGSVFFGAGLELPADAIYVYEAEWDEVTPGTEVHYWNMEPQEATVMADAIVGTFRNPTGLCLRSPMFVRGMCFDPAGVVTSMPSGLSGEWTHWSDRLNIPPGGTEAFEILLYDQPCELFVIAGVAYMD